MTDSGGLVALAARISLPCLVAAMPALGALALASGPAAAQSTAAAKSTAPTTSSLVAQRSLDAGGGGKARIGAFQQPMRLNGRPPATAASAKASTTQGARKSTLRVKRRPVKTKWSRSQIRRAQAHCAKVLRGLNLVVVPLAPMRRNACGTAAPMKLVSIGSRPKILLSPAPTLTCEMVAAMHRWVLRDVQPMARKYLGAPLKRIDIMSSYSCRNAYGRKRGKLSQHARASALDIGGFETTKGVKTAVLSHWGPRRRRHKAPVLATGGRERKNKAARKARSNATHKILRNATQKILSNAARKIPRKKANAIIAAARKAARKFAAKRRARAASKSKVKGPRTASQGSPVLRGTISGFAATGATAASKPDHAKALWNSIFADANYLGAKGRRRGRTRSRQASDGVNRSAFLHAIHKRACKVFGTVLGPDANFAHRHHFHVDTQRRKLGHYCR